MADAGYRPDKVFASSGGSLCAFIMLASDWTSSKIPLIVDNILSSLFIEKHGSQPLLRNS